MLFVGSAARTSSWRDFESLRAAAKVIGQRVHGIILVVGDDGQPRHRRDDDQLRGSCRRG